ncbi:hypothetical protein DFH06DRAFT_1212342 [Mycena polygramma]|nr:hypothetical protein DFH06DRAFT_1212342 [Mycena polygramma]
MLQMLVDHTQYLVGTSPLPIDVCADYMNYLHGFQELGSWAALEVETNPRLTCVTPVSMCPARSALLARSRLDDSTPVYAIYRGALLEPCYGPDVLRAHRPRRHCSSPPRRYCTPGDVLGSHGQQRCQRHSHRCSSRRPTGTFRRSCLACRGRHSRRGWWSRASAGSPMRGPQGITQRTTVSWKQSISSQSVPHCVSTCPLAASPLSLGNQGARCTPPPGFIRPRIGGRA